MKSCILALSLTSLLVLNSMGGTPPCATGGSIKPVYGLGGSMIYISALGPRGEVTGFSYLPSDKVAHAFHNLDGVITDLGTLGGINSVGLAISPSGAIAGASTLLGEAETHAVLFLEGTVTDLGTLGGARATPYAINAVNQVVGASLISGNSTYEAFIWSEGRMIGLGYPAYGGSYAVDVNDHGMVVGHSYDILFDLIAFIWTDGVWRDLGTLGGWSSSAIDINNAGVVVGESMTANFETHAFMWADGVMTDLGTLSNSSSALAINEAGQVIGTSAPLRGFFYQNGQTIDLGTLGGSWALPSALNNLGQVVGQSVTAEGLTHAFLWENGLIKNLNSLLPADSGWELTRADYINDAGQIVGVGLLNGQKCYFILQIGSGSNTAPQAVVPAAYPVECGEVILDASASFDPDGDSLTFAWYKDNELLGNGPQLTVLFPAGLHLVRLEVTDPCGAVGTATTTVAVADITAPTIDSLVPSIVLLSPPNNQMVPVELAVSASDNCSSAVVSRIVSVSCNAPVPDEDMQSVGDFSLLLRASKNPDGEERIYTITVAASDSAGNTSTQTVQVFVPKNRSGKTFK